MMTLSISGEYDHTLDEKNRLFISSKLRSQIDAEKFGAQFILAMGPNGILCLYPEKCFQQIALVGAPRTGAPDEAVAFERLRFALASKVELDRQGRLLINEKLRRRANLGTNLTLVGVQDHIELWNAEDWEEYITSNLPQYHNQIAEARQEQIQQQTRELEL